MLDAGSSSAASKLPLQQATLAGGLAGLSDPLEAAPKYKQVTGCFGDQ